MNEDRKQLLKDYKATFATEPGKRVLKDLFKQGHINKSSFNVDSHKTAFNEGQRDIVLYINKMIELKPIERQEKGINYA